MVVVQVRRGMKELMPSLDNNLVSSMSNLLRTMLVHGGPDEKGTNCMPCMYTDYDGV